MKYTSLPSRFVGSFELDDARIVGRLPDGWRLGVEEPTQTCEF